MKVFGWYVDPNGIKNKYIHIPVPYWYGIICAILVLYTHVESKKGDTSPTLVQTVFGL
jgi:hypothetical protein